MAAVSGSAAIGVRAHGQLLGGGIHARGALSRGAHARRHRLRRPLLPASDEVRDADRRGRPHLFFDEGGVELLVIELLIPALDTTEVGAAGLATRDLAFDEGGLRELVASLRLV